ncbi:MAG TPA: tetratricopeptide repeat protein, partial [Polyangiaceae bacterium]|nr:tetratricopeptide repeat protein [Polyangiaceae bacterium]
RMRVAPAPPAPSLRPPVVPDLSHNAPPAPSLPPLSVVRPNAPSVNEKAPSVATPAALQSPKPAAVVAPPKGQVALPAIDGAKVVAASKTRAQYAQEMITHCEHELQSKPSAERAARLHYEMARAYDSGLADLQRAGENYDAALAILPEHLPSIEGARRCHLAGKRYPKVVALFDAEVKLTSDATARALLLYEKGCLLEDRLGKRPEAREAFAAACELAPSNPTILKALERIAQQTGDFKDLDRALELQANSVIASTAHRAALIVERARHAELHQEQGATELYETALAIDPQVAGALPALKALLSKNSRWRELCEVLRQEVRVSADGMVRGMLLYRVARIQCDHLGDLEQGLIALEAAQKELPHDASVQEELARLYEAAQQWPKLASARRKLADLVRDPSSRVAALHHVGQIYEEKLNDDNAAIECFQAALKLQPAFSPALQALGKLCARKGLWETLVQMHLEEVAASDNAERRAATLCRVAEVSETHLKRPDAAVQHHLAALEQRPGYPPSFKAVVRLYSETGKWRELCELYEREVERAPESDAKISTLFKIGRIYEDCLSDNRAAMSTFARVLQIQAGHLGALHALHRVAERAGQWRELIDALKVEAGLVKSAEKSLLLRAAEVLEDRAGDQEAALACYKQVVALDESYAPALAGLGRLYFQLGRHDDLLGVYRKELSTLNDPQARAALSYKMGELCEHLLANRDEALTCYRHSVEIDPSHSSAFSALVRLLGVAGKWAEVARYTEAQLQRLSEPSAQAHAAFRLGELFENRLSQPSKALAAYSKALQAVPEYQLALDAQSRLLEATGDYETLATELMRQAKSSADHSRAVAAAYRAGELYRDRLKRLSEAMAAFEAVLEREPRHVGGLLALEQLLREQGQWARLAELYQRQALVLETIEAQIAALRARCRLLDVNGTSEELSTACHELLRLAPADPVALSILERLALSAGDAAALAAIDRSLAAAGGEAQLLSARRTRLAEALLTSDSAAALDLLRSALDLDRENLAAARGISRIAELRAEPDLLAEAARIEASVLRDSARAAQLLMASAQARRGRNDTEGAARDLEQALEIHADAASAGEQLAQILVASPARLVTALTKAAGSARVAERRAALWRRVAQVQVAAQKDRGAAISALEHAVKETPRDAECLLELATLYEEGAQWQPAAERFKQVLTLESSPQLRRTAHLKLAAIAQRHLKNAALALSQVKAVLATEPKDKIALRLLIEVELDRGNPEGAAGAIEPLLSLDLAPEERANVQWDAARVERARGRNDQFVTLAKQVVEHVGMMGEAAAGFRDWIEQRRNRGEKVDWANYTDALDAFVAKSQMPKAQRAAALFELGRVCADDLNLHERAVSYFSAGAALDRHNAALLERLAKSLERVGRWEDAAREYLAVIGLTPDRQDLWRHLHGLYRSAGRGEQARRAWAPLVATSHA